MTWVSQHKLLYKYYYTILFPWTLLLLKTSQFWVSRQDCIGNYAHCNVYTLHITRSRRILDRSNRVGTGSPGHWSPGQLQLQLGALKQIIEIVRWGLYAWLCILYQEHKTDTKVVKNSYIFKIFLWFTVCRNMGGFVCRYDGLGWVAWRRDPWPFLTVTC